jgi:superfamily I DNA and RNA helicase
LVIAHALGFGIYGKKIVQMLESPDHWEDIGYNVRSGSFTQGSQITIERPKENSLTIISELSGVDEIVKAEALTTMEEEIQKVAEQIKIDLSEALRPEDILVTCVDDRNARSYLSAIEVALQKMQIGSNNLHADAFGIRDFSKEGRVTLSTVHKAKGNEAFVVYVVGVDAVMLHPDVRKRNMLFTAVTRAKGWVRISGVGDGAKRCLEEVRAAKEHFPSLVFIYPGPEELKIMKRDLAEAADRKLKIKRVLEQLQDELSEEELEELLKETQRPRKQPRRKDTSK